MAVKFERIDPLDRQPRKAIGISIPFTGRGVFNSTYESKEAIKANLINFILTGKGERYFRPTFGSNLRNNLFNNINRDNLEELRFQTKLELENNFPGVEITNLKVSSSPDTNTTSMLLNFKVKDTLVEDEILINFE